MRTDRIYSWGTIAVLAVSIAGDLYDFFHGRVLASKGTVGSACEILAWVWFFLTVAFLPFLIMGKHKIRAAVSYLVCLPLLVAIWLFALYPATTPLVVPVWLYFLNITAYILIACVCFSTLPVAGRFFTPLPKKS